MNSSAADRLRRLRLVLTILFTAINATGLIVFAWIAIASDESGPASLDGELHRVTSSANRLLQYDDRNKTFITGYIGDDELADQCPQFAVLPGGSSTFAPYFSKRTCVPVDPARLAGLVDDAVRSGRLVTGNIRGTGDQLVRVVVEPFRNRFGQYAGATVAAADADSAQAAHTRFVVFVIGGCAVLVAVLAVAGHLLSTRAMRPAVAALEQQEILLAETAHDLRTPVAALRALAETALRNPDERTELLPRTVGLAARMGTIIDGLLVRARLAAGMDQLAVQPVWLDQLVTGLVDDTPADGASVTVTAAPSLVQVDPTLVQRAVGNLLDNALRYGRQGDQPAIVHITVANGRVTVADHGPGVDGKIAEELLDRFRTGSGSTGLGLSIVRWVAQAHGGALNVYNADEGGAIFELELPVLPHPN
ncbi:sensor histidine kinase [Amycolatopsis sp. CA-230715]|uniref:sensor histidine kinase n=1 Tax=Amycolatopsis sp. CA-230715 TaxID=2745196 RepID=UPI001C00A9B9|nr:HAMP domain-containing sensor histidine kinase [Amycolatopsis sp. CA-230715]QWF82076.1 Adaptive-response sensory-kinase SasA [Amycolatopsis sp. CA-230715]